MSAGIADRILASTLATLAECQDMLSTAARLDDDQQAARQALQAAQAVMDARQALLAITVPQAPQAALQVPLRPIEDYAPKGPVTWEQVRDSMTVGEWVGADDVVALVDWTGLDAPPKGRRGDVVHRLNYMVFKGVADRQPPLRDGRKARNVKWRRLA